MGDSSSAEPPAPPSQRCCLGMLYYSEALRKEHKKPLCVGLTHTPSQHIEIADRSQLVDGVAEYKFVCLGHSVYEGYAAKGSGGATASASSSSSNEAATLPYCEGLEVVLAGHLDAVQQQQQQQAAAQQHLQHQHQQQQPRPPGGADFQQVDAGSFLAGLIGPPDGPAAKFISRFQVVADRNLRIMRSTLNTAYNLTLRPFFDKLAEDSGPPDAGGSSSGGGSTGSGGSSSSGRGGGGSSGGSPPS